MVKGSTSATRERRCIVTGESAPVTGLVRLVMGPENVLVPDVAEKLPGRGIWISADGDLIRSAAADGRLAKGASRSLKTGVKASSIPSDLPEMIERLLTRRALDRLGLERRAGRLVTGFEKVRAALGDPGQNVMVLLAASDGTGDGRTKIRAKAAATRTDAQPAHLVEYFDREELGQALGRDNMVHAAVLAGGAGKRLVADLNRLNGFRKAPQAPDNGAADRKD